jgi:hypothetical protein
MLRCNASLTRRRFVQGAGVAGLGLLAGCGRLPWQAPARVAHVGWLSPGAQDSPPEVGRFNRFLQSLADYGWE